MMTFDQWVEDQKTLDEESTSTGDIASNPFGGYVKEKKKKKKDCGCGGDCCKKD